jgi:hypothetical protein
MPPPQRPAGCASFAIPLPRAANVDHCCASFVLAHDGHSVTSSLRRTSFSNFVPHDSQAYS